MENFAKTKENIAIVESLKKIKETQWIGNLVFDSITKCLASMNLQSGNSGHYNPIPTRINGLKGIFMINENGNINPEAKIIKDSEKEYRIEWMSNSAYNEFENNYCKLVG